MLLVEQIGLISMLSAVKGFSIDQHRYYQRVDVVSVNLRTFIFKVCLCTSTATLTMVAVSLAWSGKVRQNNSYQAGTAHLSAQLSGRCRLSATLANLPIAGA
ncbi:hypothetical protein HG15A2_16720 [Adhaeretor mobilis]|uniref:Uncharacterized protein n=1 Tax=Adhaeretor mobilis TaxID=1930276 RepID=A0A517MU37_9BACT|nr:hypothetical protein HG15A2_16720 [Adhaeretor mobilis]